MNAQHEGGRKVETETETAEDRADDQGARGDATGGLGSGRAGGRCHNEPAAARARARGVEVVQNLCSKMEYQRLFGELRMGGINTGVISI